MTKQELLKLRDYFNLVNGVTLRAIGLLEDRDLDFRPSQGMRTPRELIYHIYAQEKLLAEAARSGKMTLEMANRSNPEDPSTADDLARLVTVRDALAFAAACHGTAEQIFRALSEVDVSRPVEGPFGSYPASQYHLFAYDEHWHHRGQLYAYLRLLGKEPPMLYDYQ
jgi:uncharacterized damage-inducible protein DinB